MFCKLLKDNLDKMPGDLRTQIGFKESIKLYNMFQQVTLKGFRIPDSRFRIPDSYVPQTLQKHGGQ